MHRFPKSSTGTIAGPARKAVAEGAHRPENGTAELRADRARKWLITAANALPAARKCPPGVAEGRAAG